MAPIVRLHRMAELVVALQDRYDAEHLRTTGANFLQEHGDQSETERNRIMSEINMLRTEAIWSLGKLLDGIGPTIPRAIDAAA